MAFRKIKTKARSGKAGKRKPKQYEYTFWNSYGKPIRKRFNTQAEGEEWLVEMRKRRDRDKNRSSTAKRKDDLAILDAIAVYKNTPWYRTRATKTQQTYDSRIKRLLGFCGLEELEEERDRIVRQKILGNLRVKYIRDINNQQFADDFMSWLFETMEGSSPSSYFDILIALLKKNRIPSAFMDIFRPSVEYEPRPHTEEELRELFRVANEYQSHVLSLLCNLGLRADEFQTLTWAQIDFDGVPHVKIVEHTIERLKGGILTNMRWTPKTFKRVVTINKNAMADLNYFKARSNGGKYVLPSEFGKSTYRPVSHNYINKVVYGKLKEQAILAIPSLAETSTHTCRKTFDSTITQELKSFEMASELAGHDVEVAKAHYALLRLEDKKFATDAIVQRLQIPKSTP